MTPSNIAKTATKVLDSLQVSQFGGNLEKAQLDIYELKDGHISPDSPPRSLKLWLNPHTVEVSKEVEFAESPQSHGTTNLHYSHTKPLHLSIGEMWFDTYDTRESVREVYIDHLEELLSYNKDTHVLNGVVFTWGNFSARTRLKANYIFLPSKMTVKYTMFLPCGMPCRANVALCLKQLMTPEMEGVLAPKQSPDHARIYTVKRGDTLQGIARMAYDTPAEWRRIASYNQIDDPMSIQPGQSLLLPPILK